MLIHKVKILLSAGVLSVSLVLGACSGVSDEITRTVDDAVTAISTLAPETPVAWVAPTALSVPNATAEPTSVPVLSVDAASFPDPAGFAWKPVISGLNKPLGLGSSMDGSGRLFILEQPGVIQIYQDGGLLPDPFLDISDKVQSGGNEQGLLGIAFHPDFSQNGYFYINYTGLQGIGDTVIARYQVPASDPNRADPHSEKVLLTVKQPYRNHNGGWLAFGPDGYLYFGLGDGGSGGDPQGNGQSLDMLLGKLLRIDVNHGDPYAIPADNPFAAGGGRPEIWAYGLRNPWRFSFDRQTGDIFIGDVGQDQWEEVDFLAAGLPGGANLGWNIREGTHAYAGDLPVGASLVEPIFEYQHSVGCSISGGYVYRGKNLPEFSGIYLVGDFCNGQVWGILGGAGKWQSQQLFQTGFNVTSFGQDGDGELYLIDLYSGTVYRLERK